MQVNIPTENNLLPDRYGKYADEADRYNGRPVVSFPFSISDVPAGTKTLAIRFIDHDSIPVAGFTWIHWTAVNIDPSITEFPADASRHHDFDMTQGKNSSAGHLVGETDPKSSQGYTGPTPPNSDHAYTLTVYALDTELPLHEGYWLNEFYHASEGHIIDSVSQDVISRK
ncbi:YbhB/YbcL family Raf kinase inhibitor-like protein [Paucilactobacillus suebicus]|nr:YbhB/YbcL family Raf kinase inhibitor-like protein [Paucilactobacillus suebicus]